MDGIGHVADDADDMETEASELAIVRHDPYPCQDIKVQLRDANVASPNGTLLPTPVASVVSFATRSTGLAIRIGTTLGGYGLDVAKLTTLSGLELGRGILEGILNRAGKDTVSLRNPDLARADAENMLERTIESFHHTMGQIVFWTAASFSVTSTALSMASEMSQFVLSTLDQFFGSTDSSRAMASIITMIRREFEKPAAGVCGEKTGVLDLVTGLCGVAYLQRLCRGVLEEEISALRVEETVWDVVVLNDGVRVDIQETCPRGTRNGTLSRDEIGVLSQDSSERIIAAIQTDNVPDINQDCDEMPARQLEREIMRSLPDNAKVSITREVCTSEIITVDITGEAPHARVEPPPGIELIEENWGTGQIVSEIETNPEDAASCSRFVFRHERRLERKTSLQKVDGDVVHVTEHVEQPEIRSLESMVTGNGEAVPPPQRKTSSHRIRAHLDQLSPSTRAASTSSTPRTAPPNPGSQTPTKRKRPPVSPSSRSTVDTRSSVPSRTSSSVKPLSSKSKEELSSDSGHSEKRAKFRGVLKRSKSIFSKDNSGFEAAADKKKSTQASARLSPAKTKAKAKCEPSALAARSRRSSLIPKEVAPTLSQTTPGGGRNPSTRPTSRTGYFSMHGSLRESTISLTGTFSITTADDAQPVAAFSDSTPTCPDVQEVYSESGPTGPNSQIVPRVKKPPSIFTLRADEAEESETSLIAYQTYCPKHALSAAEALGALRQAGIVRGIFPRQHLLRNITRYMRFASASYGSSLLRMLGIATEMPLREAFDDTHHEVRSFAHHTKTDTASVRLASFVDAQGGSDGTGSTNTGVPLVHYISVDHYSKAVVLTCRGTLGFEDVLTDLTCEYDNLVWRGNTYEVHKGVHASAKRLLYGGDGRVLRSLKQALVDFPHYGLVLTGHSLGGAVTSLLGVMLSEPGPESSFVTASSEPHPKLLGDGIHAIAPPPTQVRLPAGRPIHVYAYGPPSTMSAALSEATRGLITTVVNGNDLVPYLSLGVLHDFQAVALALKTDNSDAKAELRRRMWQALRAGAGRAWRGDDEAFSFAQQMCGEGKKEDSTSWAYALLKVLRAGMTGHKLLPPGEVFVVESMRVLRRDAFVVAGEADPLGRPARRVVLKYVRDVARRFREVRFGVSMLTDHSPGKYEDALNRLMVGVMGTG
ncbi:hypothetical protein VTK56DRAFT_8367 [Thermocarpiscus australiensis]